MLVKWIRWLMGYVEFELVGGFPERFINSAVRDKINIWNIRKLKDGISADAVSEDYIRLKKISKRCGCRTKIVKKHGFPFSTRKYRSRVGLIAGAFVFSGVIYFLSSYIWSIDVTGNVNIPTEDILAVMRDVGLSSGSLKKRVDIPIVKQEAMIHLPSVAWMSINIMGSHANISIKEKIDTPGIVGEDKPCNIKAACDGRVERIETFMGTPVVSEGDAVLKGQLLISGVLENQVDKNVFVHSDGKIYAHTKRTLQESVPLAQTTAADTGKIKNKYRLKILGLELPFGFWSKTDETYRCEFYSNRLNIGQVNLPIVLYRERWYEQVCDQIQLTYDEAVKRADDLICCKEKEDFKDKKIITKDLEDREENGVCILTAKYSCLEDIGTKEIIEFN